MRFMLSTEELQVFPTYFKTASALDNLFKKEHIDITSTEALNSSLAGRLLVSICDVLTGVLATGRTNLFKFYKTLKRSEIREFVESNRAKTFVVEHLPFEKCFGTQIDVPANMAKTYKDAIASVQNIYARLNAVQTLKMIDASFTNIYRAVSTGNKNVADLINTSSEIANRTAAAAKPAILQCQKEFSGKFSEKREFEKVFLTMQELVECKNELLVMEERLQAVHKLASFVESMEQSQKGIIDSFDESLQLTPKELYNLGEMSKNVALIFDAYGLAAIRQAALEHNWILCVNTLYTTCK